MGRRSLTNLLDNVKPESLIEIGGPKGGFARIQIWDDESVGTPGIIYHGDIDVVHRQGDLIILHKQARSYYPTGCIGRGCTENDPAWYILGRIEPDLQYPLSHAFRFYHIEGGCPGKRWKPYFEHLKLEALLWRNRVRDTMPA